MNNQIYKYQQRLFYNLFANYPSVKKVNNFETGLNLDHKIDSVNCFANKELWFVRGENKEKYYYLFGIRDKPIKDISQNDVSLIIDFDKNNQFNDDCLGLFRIKNSEIHILINNRILNERYTYINQSGFKTTNIKSFDESIDLDVIDLGKLGNDFIVNIERLVSEAYALKSKKEESSEKINSPDDLCKICNKKISDFKIDSKLKSLNNLKPKLCGKCIEKIVASEFYTKIISSLNSYDTKDIAVAKENFGNDQVFDIGLKLLEKYGIISYFGVKKLIYTVDRDSYLVKKYMKYSNKNNLLMDNIFQTNQSKTDNKKANIPKIIKTDSFGNKNTLKQMNIILEDLTNGKSEKEAIKHANVSQNTYDYWINRGKQNFGEIYVQFYEHINKIKYGDYDDEELGGEVIENMQIDPDIYAPLPDEYEKSFNHTPMNQSGIAWVSKIGNKWIYTKIVNGNNIRFSEKSIYELHSKVKSNNQIWGIRDYDRAKKFIDIPDDFEIPQKSIDEKDINAPIKIDPDIHAPLPEEYENQFSSSSHKTGIAWVSRIGKKWIYQRMIEKKKIGIADEDIYGLHQKVKEHDLIWGIYDYTKAKKIIDIPEKFIIPKSIEKPIEISSDILAPLPDKYLSSFNPNQKNKTGIAWVYKIGKRWIYKRRVNKANIEYSEYDIHKLHETVINNNQIWGIIDFKKAIPIIEKNKINEEPNPQISKKPIDTTEVSVNYIEKSTNEIEVIIKGVIENSDLIIILNRLNLFKEDITRIIATSINNKLDIFIELKINRYLKKSFQEEIHDLGWKIDT